MGWFELSFQPVPEGIFILSIDITERKKTEESIRLAEANYREIFEKAGDAIHVMDSDTGVVLEANQKACEITGYTKEVLIHGNRRDMLSGDPQYSLEAVNGFLQKAAAGEPQLFEWLIKKKDGSLSWIEVDLKKATIAGKERLLSFYREINERKKVQREIQELNGALEQKVSGRTAELEKANSELEAFSYSVSHDLRAPLRGIAGFSAMLENKYGSQLDGEGKRITAVIRKNTIRMGELIDDLLAFSRLGRQPISKSTIASQAMVQEIVNELDTNGKPVQWQIGHLPECWGDLKTIRQVWVNLISNAVKYSRETPEPIIEIGTYMENKEQIFFVRDNGVGFDDKYKHKLFKVFQRLHSVAEFEGTGVGLAIVEKIISRHGGRVWATAEKGKGASFCFTLPECSA
jgi:PAS domain S-box-containing protein